MAAASRSSARLGRGVGERVGLLACGPAPRARASSGSVSTSRRFIICTAPAGSWPTAVSSDSITASVPSSTAFATSVTSARVGSGLVTIDTSICVAVITGRPARLAARMMRFCVAGTRSIGISTPRSPRATMIASAAATIASSRSSACCFSIFATSGSVGERAAPRRGRARGARRRWRRSRAPARRCRARSARSLSVSAGSDDVSRGRLIPLRERERPADAHAADDPVGAHLERHEVDRPVGDVDRIAGPDALVERRIADRHAARAQRHASPRPRPPARRRARRGAAWGRRGRPARRCRAGAPAPGARAPPARAAARATGSRAGRRRPCRAAARARPRDPGPAPRWR